MKKLLGVLLVVSMIMMMAVSSFVVNAATNTVIEDITNFTGKFTIPGKTTTNDAGKVVMPAVESSYDVAGLKISAAVPAGVYKAAFFFTLGKIKDVDNPPQLDVVWNQDDRLRCVPTGDAYMNNPIYPYDGQHGTFTGLSTVSEQKIVIITVFEVKTALTANTLEMKYVWANRFGSFFETESTLDRIVLAGGDYDFGVSDYTGYKIFNEANATEGGGAYQGVAGTDWVESGAIPVGGEDPDPTDDPNKTEAPVTTTKKPDNGDSPKTGDASAVMVLLTAAAATCGGFVLKSKKRK